MMNGVNVFLFLAFVCTGIDAQWITKKVDEGTVATTDGYWVVKMNGKVNPPTSAAYIRFYNKHTAKSEYEIDCSTSDKVLYYNDPDKGIGDVIFLTKDHIWAEGDYYITLDEGVLYSNSIEKSMEQLSPKFWEFRAVRPPSFQK